MLKKLKKMYYTGGASIAVGLLTATEAHAQPKLNDVTKNMVMSMDNLPGLITAVTYLAGLLLCILGIMKVKDHVENPSQTPLKDGSIRLAAGGALLAAQFMWDALSGTVDDGHPGTVQDVAQVTKVNLNNLQD